jgi:hypothetical protein
MPTGAADRIAIRVTPSFGFAPATVQVVATVRSNERSRAIEIVAESESYYRSSTMPLEGEVSFRSNRFEFRGLPGGEYAITAALIDADGTRTATTEHVRLVSRF